MLATVGGFLTFGCGGVVRQVVSTTVPACLSDGGKAFVVDGALTRLRGLWNAEWRAGGSTRCYSACFGDEGDTISASTGSLLPYQIPPASLCI